jgi:hypothetical protein
MEMIRRSPIRVDYAPSSSVGANFIHVSNNPAV